MENRLYRSRTNSMIAGVCGGLGQYLRIDPTLIRLFFVLLALGNGIGVFVYLLLWVIIPPESRVRETTLGEAARQGADEIADQVRSISDDLRQTVVNPNPQVALFIGLALVLLGLVYLAQNLRLSWLRWVEFDVFWPVLLIVGGLALLIRHIRGE